MLAITEALGQPKIHYWGFSYGTYLGLTFATLFPDKIDRMVLDGNVDAVEFSSGAGTHFLEDTDKVWGAFFTFCHLAGAKRCALYGDSPSEIEERVDKLFAQLRVHPVIVPGSAPGERPEIVSYSTVKRVISAALYRPVLQYPVLAAALSEIEIGNGLPILTLSGKDDEESLLCGGGESDEPSEGTEDATNAIFCSDNGGWAENGTVEDFGVFLKTAEERSRSMTSFSNLMISRLTVRSCWCDDGFDGNCLCGMERKSEMEVYWYVTTHPKDDSLTTIQDRSKERPATRSCSFLI